MYLITDKHKNSFWRSDLLEVVNLAKNWFKGRDFFVYEEEYGNMKLVNREYVLYLFNNPARPNDLQVGDKFMLYNNDRIYTVKEMKFNEHDKYYTHVVEVDGKVENHILCHVRLVKKVVE